MSASITQRFLHWLEMGGGSHLTVRLAIALATATLLTYAGWQRFEGPDDRTMEQTLVARQLAEGKGYSTPVIWPQSVAVLKESKVLAADWQPSSDHPLPELHHAPGYPTLIGAALLAAGEKGRAWLFERPSMEGTKVTSPFRADLLLLGLNLACAIGLAALAALLAQRIFNPWAGLLTLAGVVSSLALGKAIAAVDGTVFLAFLAILLAWCWEAKIRAAQENRTRAAFLWTGLGTGVVVCLYLTEYTAGLLLFPWLVSAAWCSSGRLRVLLPFAALAIFGHLITPWTVRNLELTGHPMALAGQGLALKSGDPTAEPLTYRNTDSAASPEVSFRKVLNKGFKGVEEAFSERLWSGGGQFLSAFAVACLLYRFRQPRTSRVRLFWMAAWLFAVIGQPFFSSGESPRHAAIWLSPWLMILGSGFFMILVESLRQPSALLRAGIVSALLILNALPILHHLSAPKALPFRITQHLPARLGTLGAIASDSMRADHHFVTDAPAALAWYGNITTWSLPETYKSLTDLHRRHFLCGLLLTGRTQEKSLYSKLIPQAVAEANADTPQQTAQPLPINTGWAMVWADIFRQVVSSGKETSQLPRDFPFQRMILLPELGLGKTILFLNPLAQKPRSGN